MGVCASENAKEVKRTYPNGLKMNKRTQKWQQNEENSCSDEDQLKKDLDECFDKFDLNHDGYLDTFELTQLIKVIYNKTGQGRDQAFYRHAAMDLLQRADYGSQGKMNRSDFYRFYKEY